MYRDRDQLARCGGEATQSEIGFAGARFAGDEGRTAADGDGGAVMRVSRVAHWAAPPRWVVGAAIGSAHREARPGRGRVVRRAPLLVAVLGDDLAGVRQHDLARNAEAQAGVLAAARVGRRTIRIKAVEDDLQAVGRDARAFVLDEDLDDGAAARACTVTVPPSGENEMALSMRLVSTWPSRPSSPLTQKAPGNGSLPTASISARLSSPMMSRKMETTLRSIAVTSTARISLRASSASSREAFETSVISRLRRFSSLWICTTRCVRSSSVLA